MSCPLPVLSRTAFYSACVLGYLWSGSRIRKQSMTIKSSKKARTQQLKEVIIYCDGSSLGNGRAETRAAAVALLGFRGVWRAFGEYLGGATNQQAEVAAAALGREQLREPCRVTVLSDSSYVVETMSGRVG